MEVLVVSLNIHPLQYNQVESFSGTEHKPGDMAYPDKQNTGEEDANFTGNQVKDVSFTIYDITEYYKEGEATDTAGNKITAKSIQREFYYNPATFLTNHNITTLTTTDPSTESTPAVSKELPIFNSEKKLYTAYLIVQNESGQDTLNKAYPMVVTMPVYLGNDQGNNTSDGELLTNIHLYPKMEKGSIFAEPKDPKVTTDPKDPKYPSNPKNPIDDPNYVGNKGIRQSVDYNQTITYGFNLTIPRGTLTNPEVNDYKISFNSTESADSKKYFENKNIKLYTKDGEVSSTLYTVSNSSITFRKSKTPAEILEGKVITVLFTTSLKDNTPPDEDIPLKVSGTTKDGDPVSFDLKSVYTGGSHFKVIDSNASNETTDYKQFITNSRFYITKKVDDQTYYAKVKTMQETEANTEQDETVMAEQFSNQNNTKSYTFVGWEKLTDQTQTQKTSWILQ